MIDRTAGIPIIRPPGPGTARGLRMSEFMASAAGSDAIDSDTNEIEEQAAWHA